MRGEENGRKRWWYVLLVDDEETQDMFEKQVSTGNIDVEDFGQVLESGWGEDPPDEAKYQAKLAIYYS